MKTITAQFEVEDCDDLSDLVIRLGRYDAQCTLLPYRILPAPAEPAVGDGPLQPLPWKAESREGPQRDYGRIMTMDGSYVASVVHVEDARLIVECMNRYAATQTAPASAGDEYVHDLAVDVLREIASEHVAASAGVPDIEKLWNESRDLVASRLGFKSGWDSSSIFRDPYPGVIKEFARALLGQRKEGV